MGVFDYFDKVFVINLDHRTDRWANVIKEFNRFEITNYERCSGVKIDFNDIPSHWYNQMTSPEQYLKEVKTDEKDGSTKKEWNPSYIRGSIGCKLSHQKIITLAKERGYENILILEDDVEFLPDLNKVNDILSNSLKELKKIPDWYMLYLSGNHLKQPIPVKNMKNIHKCITTLTTHAYALNARAFDYILENMMIGCEIDVFYAGAVQRTDKCYAIRPTIATQYISYSDVLNAHVDYTRIVT